MKRCAWRWSVGTAVVLVVASSGVCLANELHDAAKEGKTEIVAGLIKRGIAINEKDDDGFTPLHIAIKGYNFATAQALVKAGADVNAKGQDGMTPLIWTIRQGLMQVVVKPLSSVAEKLSAPDDIAEGDENAAPGQFEFAKFLVKNDADPKMADANKDTPLHYATFMGYVQIVKWLVEECKVKVNAVKVDGGTPLHYAASKNYTRIADFLIQKGAKVNVALIGEGEKGLTPLMIAAYNGHEPMVKLLISKGADIEVKEASGKTALDCAKEAKQTTIVQILERAQAAKREKKKTTPK